MLFSVQAAPLIGVVTPLLALAFAAVGLRLYVRVVQLHNPGADDWLCVGAICFTLATYLANVVGATAGFGDPLPSMTPENRTLTLQVRFFVPRKSVLQTTLFNKPNSQTIWISPPLWGLSTSLIKLSILTSYQRIWTSRSFSILANTLMTLITIFALTLFLGGILSCIPIQLSWEPPSSATRNDDDDARCINIPMFMFATSILNTGFDLLLFAIPVPLIRNLQIAPRQRYALLAVFTVGAVVCIASVMRLVSIYELDPTTDPSTSGVRLGLWSGVESNLAITCACLPTLRPLLARLFPRLLGGLTNAGGGTPSWPVGGGGVGLSMRRWSHRVVRDGGVAFRMREMPSGECSCGCGRGKGGDDINNVEAGRIRVKSTICVDVDVDVEHRPAPAYTKNKYNRSYMDFE
ncbi:hypothetical protein M426DRAFT_8457 [Hypoxylon sp. CI-4A]|nr:hypothetical protein M426DRAFT_8457 [Hypoxylon sp. CI-4A]